MRSLSHELNELVFSFKPMLEGLDSAVLNFKLEPDKWSKKEILGHLIDSANNNHQKFVRGLASKEVKITGYEQANWVKLQNYQTWDWTLMVNFWAQYNTFLAQLILQIPESAYQNELMINESGPHTLLFVVTDYVEHLKHHLLQIFPEVDLSSIYRSIY